MLLWIFYFEKLSNPMYVYVLSEMRKEDRREVKK